MCFSYPGGAYNEDDHITYYPNKDTFKKERGHY